MKAEDAKTGKLLGTGSDPRRRPCGRLSSPATIKGVVNMMFESEAPKKP